MVKYYYDWSVFMYKKKNRAKQHQMQFITLDDLVPADHILRLIDDAIDFSFIYDEVEGLYASGRDGRPGIDPVSLFKIIFIQYLFGIRSMRQTIKEIEVNTAYRWFIGYELLEPIPHFSTFSKNYTRRFKDTDIFEKIFQHILQNAVNNGFVDASAVFIDGTHIKASANKHKTQKVTVTKPIPQYKSELDQEIDNDRSQKGKKPFDRDGNNDKTIKRTVSTTDPDSGMFVKGEHERQLAYVANTACDKHNFVLGFYLGAGNIHDSQMFHEVFKKLYVFKSEIKAVAVDAGYKTPGIMREIIQRGMIPVVPYKRPMTKKGFIKKTEYVYDEYYDCYICPANKLLNYSTTNREGYREYKSNPLECSQCPYIEKCTMSRNHTKVVTRHIWSEYMEYAEEYRHVFQYKEIYKQRRETIERVFADAKERHGLRYTMLRGLEKVKMQATLTFACMNLKKLAIWKHRKRLQKPPVHGKNGFFEKIKYKLLYKAKIWQRVWITRCHICLQSEHFILKMPLNRLIPAIAD